jgi:hypothetical protein
MSDLRPSALPLDRVREAEPPASPLSRRPSVSSGLVQARFTRAGSRWDRFKFEGPTGC